MDHTLVWAGSHEPGKEKNITYWRNYCSKEKLICDLSIGDSIDDAKYAAICAARPAKAQGKRNDLLQVKHAIDAGESVGTLIETSDSTWLAAAKHKTYFTEYQSEKRRRTEPQLDLEVEVFWGATGTGKTRKAYEIMGYDELHTWRWVPGSGTTFYDGYCGQDNVIFDEFRGQIPLGQILTLLDVYPTRVQIKGGSVHWSPKKIILTSPIHPREWYLSVGGDKIDQLLRRIKKITEFKTLSA